MGFAEDKVYEYILKNLRNFKNIRVASLADSLSCLTDADRDELHSREETRGSQATVYRFYQHLKCRQGWVPDLIDALHHNNAGHLADELQRVYDFWQVRTQSQTNSAPPGAPAPVAAPFPPAAAPFPPAAAPFPPAVSSAHPAASTRAQTPALEPVPVPSVPLAEQLCQDLPRVATTDQDTRTPVQESLSKALPEQESLQPPLPGSAVCDGMNNGSSREGHLLRPTEATPGAASMDVALAVPPGQGQAWLSRRQQPVCVDNGCFGNANHLQRGAPGLGLPARQPGTAPRPQPPVNEPQEDLYLSTESPPRLEGDAHGAGLQPSDSTEKKQAVPSCEPPGSFVDVRSPLLIQQQFDVEQKQGRMLQEDGGDTADTRMETATPVATHVPTDTSPSHTTPLNLAQEDKPPVGEMASSTHSPAKEKVHPALVDPLPHVAGSLEVPSGRMASRVSSGTRVCSDVELSEPGTLVSISSFSLSSDPLFISTDNSRSGEVFSSVSSRCPAPAPHADPKGEEAAGASRDSCPPLSWDSTSLSIYENHYPSIQLGEDNNVQDGANPLGNPPVLDSSKGCGAVNSLPEARVSPGDSSRPSLPYILPAVGVALISAFLVYNRLQK